MFVQHALTREHWRRVAKEGVRIVECEDLADITDTDERPASVRQIWLHGECRVPASFLARFPNLESLRVRGNIHLHPDRRRMALQRVSISDLNASAADLLAALQVRVLEVTGEAKDLASAVLGQKRMQALHLQETKLDLNAVWPVLPRLKKLALHRVHQRDYGWFSGARNLRDVSLAYQRNFSDLGSISGLKALRLLALSSQKKLEGFEKLARLSQLQMLSLCNLGEIPSLLGLRSLHRLQILQVLGDCKVRDGKIAFLKDMPSLVHVAIVPKKGYDCPANDFEGLSGMETLQLQSERAPKGPVHVVCGSTTRNYHRPHAPTPFRLPTSEPPGASSSAGGMLLDEVRYGS